MLHTGTSCDLAHLLRSLEPVLNAGTYIFASVPFDFDIGSIESRASLIATVREVEGLTLVVEESALVESLGLRVLFRSRWITLNVHSDLEAVGLTAAFSSKLGESGISCNVIAGAFHDHIFVPVDRAEEAMLRLKELQSA